VQKSKNFKKSPAKIKFFEKLSRKQNFKIGKSKNSHEILEEKITFEGRTI